MDSIDPHLLRFSVSERMALHVALFEDSWGPLGNWSSHLVFHLLISSIYVVDLIGFMRKSLCLDVMNQAYYVDSINFVVG